MLLQRASRRQSQWKHSKKGQSFIFWASRESSPGQLIVLFLMCTIHSVDIRQIKHDVWKRLNVASPTRRVNVEIAILTRRGSDGWFQTSRLNSPLVCAFFFRRTANLWQNCMCGRPLKTCVGLNFCSWHLRPWEPYCGSLWFPAVPYTYFSLSDSD